MRTGLSRVLNQSFATRVTSISSLKLGCREILLLLVSLLIVWRWAIHGLVKHLGVGRVRRHTEPGVGRRIDLLLLGTGEWPADAAVLAGTDWHLLCWQSWKRESPFPIPPIHPLSPAGRSRHEKAFATLNRREQFHGIRLDSRRAPGFRSEVWVRIKHVEVGKIRSKVSRLGTHSGLLVNLSLLRKLGFGCLRISDLLCSVARLPPLERNRACIRGLSYRLMCSVCSCWVITA